MSNKVQINCNPNNKMRISLLKQEWIKLRMNQECVEDLEKEINGLELHTQMAIQNPYHLENDHYNDRKWWLNEFRKNARIIIMWIRVYSSDISERTS